MSSGLGEEGFRGVVYRPRWSLPLFLTRQNRFLIGGIWTAIAATLYLTTNHHPIFEPRLLPMTRWDEWVPFMPNTIWFYLSEYPLFFAVFFSAKDMKNVNKYLYSFLVLQVISVAVFVIFPTTYPRERFPLPTDMNALSYYAFSHLRATDAPDSCLPSLHVSSCYLSSFVYLDEQKSRFPIFFLWATAVGISTLTTKQHYIIDVVAGLGMAIMVYWIMHRWVPYRDLKS